MRLARKRIKIYSVFTVMFITMAVTIINISWKIDKTKEINPAKTSHREAEEINPKAILFINYVNRVYEEASLKDANLALPVFEKAIVGFYNLKNSHQLNQEKDIITVIDFTRPSSEKRLWIIDLKNNKLLLNTYVAHGQGSGENTPKLFSNIEESHQSSLGFYITNETYIGNHGLSLRLDGFEKGLNDKARERAIVIHGAAYVSEAFIKQTGRLGRSFGCPAIPNELTETIITLIKDKTCLYINGNNNQFQSLLLNQEMAFNCYSDSIQS